MSRHDDILARATRSLREETSAPAREADKTRARILLLASKKRRRPTRLLWMAPLAAALAASTAWAATHGVLPRAWQGVTALFVAHDATNREPPSHMPHHGAASRGGEISQTPAKGSAGGAASAVPEVTFDSLPVAAVPVDSLPSSRPLSRSFAVPPVSRAAPPSSVAPGPASSVPADGTEATRLYAVAHEAHFVTQDPDAALAAWDAYLRAAPDGPLAPEARYNRALTLIRLGRKDEAREALTPFARGEVDGYREREARKLLEALGEP